MQNTLFYRAVGAGWAGPVSRAAPAVLLLSLSIVCATHIGTASADVPQSEEEIKQETQRLQGRWKLVALETMKPASGWDCEIDLVVERNQLTCKITFKGGSIVVPLDDIVVDFSVGRSHGLKTIDFVMTLKDKPNMKDVVKGIYTLDQDILRVCFGTSERGRPERFPTDKSSPFAVLSFKRQTR